MSSLRSVPAHRPRQTGPQVTNDLSQPSADTVKRRTVRRGVLGVSVSYLLLWLTTAVVGAPQIEAQIGARLRAELGAPAVQVHRLGEPFARGRPVPFPHYVVSASSPGPLLVRLKYSSQQ